MIVYDLAIAGGGPAGLAVGIEAASRGLSAVVFERRTWPVDKACGEGLMPAGVRALESLGAWVDSAGYAPFEGIRYLQEDGTVATGRFGGGPGLGVRRVALNEALFARARGVGVELRQGCAVQRFEAFADFVSVLTDGGEVCARLLVAADGLASPLRRQAGLEGAPVAARRFGVRRHFGVAPWSTCVDVHWAEGAEAYVTPAGPRSVGVAFLWDEARLGPQRFDGLLARFPVLRERLAGRAVESEDRGAGPLERNVLERVAGRVVLAGDAAGYVDALSGEGVSLALAGASALGSVLEHAVVRGAPALAPYERAAEEAFRRYAWLTRGLLVLSRRPSLRRQVIRGLAARPALFSWLLDRAVGDGAALPVALAQTGGVAASSSTRSECS